jgi:hypothetical protein
VGLLLGLFDPEEAGDISSEMSIDFPIKQQYHTITDAHVE